MATKKLQLLTDLPINEPGSSAKDGLNFEEYATVLSRVAENTSGPFTIGIFGDWGTGKTSLMRLIEEKLISKDKIIPVWFNAWRYEKEDEPLFPLVATIIRHIEKNSSFLNILGTKSEELLNALRSIAYGLSTEVELGFPGLGNIKTGLDAKSIVDRGEKLELDPIKEKSSYIDAYDALDNAPIPASVKIVIIIDDLDRCFPDHAIKLLESIKLILNQPGFIFILGVAKKVLEGYLEHRYQKDYGIKELQGEAYLDKIVQLPFHIPPHHSRMDIFWERMIDRLDENDQKDFKDLREILIPATGSNPRTAVRFINNLLIDRAIYEKIPFDNKLKKIHISFFAVTRSLQLRWQHIFKSLSANKQICDDIKENITTQKTIDYEILINRGHKSIAEYIQNDKELEDLLTSEFGQQ